MEKSLALLATGAAAVVLLTVQEANRSADAGRQDPSDLSEQNAQRPRAQDDRLYADRVYLGEPPRDGQGRPAAPGTTSGRVVVNASGLRMEEVWVLDNSGNAISIRSAERCTMYALPAEFDAQHLFFTDPNGSWHRPLAGPVERLPHYAPAPETDSGDHVWSAVMTDCAG